MPKKEIKEVVEEKEEVVEPKVEQDILEPQADDTPEKVQYRTFLKEYKSVNPEKFEKKKGVFEAQLKGNIRMESNPASKRKTFYFN